MSLTEQRKSCSKCGEDKALSSFYKRSLSPDGHEAECKGCRKKRNGKWFSENKDRHHEMTRDWYRNNRDYHLGKTKERYESDKAYALEKYYRRENRTKQATPEWVDRNQIISAYREARRLTEATGVKHEVDHIIPLQGKTVSGLHVHNNLQVIPARLNKAKFNSTWPDMP